jgi:hypothetical protein
MSISVVEKNILITSIINNWRIIFQKDITSEQLSVIYTYLYIISCNFIFVSNFNFERSSKIFKSENEGINSFLTNIDYFLFEIFNSGNIENLVGISREFEDKNYILDIYNKFSVDSSPVNRLAETNH